MLGDKAYDSAELREELHGRGTKPIKVAPPVVLLKNGTLEIGILQTGSYNIENVDRLPARQQDDAR